MEWHKTLRTLEQKLKRNELKDFYALANKVCKMKPSAPLVSGIKAEGESILYNRFQIEDLMAEDFKRRQEELDRARADAVAGDAPHQEGSHARPHVDD